MCALQISRRVRFLKSIKFFVVHILAESLCACIYCADDGVAGVVVVHDGIVAVIVIIVVGICYLGKRI